ncbi:MAG: HAMP domain-containing sensor histidine kinase, partial [Pseudomonadota bacterium]
QGKPFKYEHSCMIQGSRSWFYATVVKLGEDGVTIQFANITARKSHEREREQLIQALEAKNEELESFTYTVSHDLKSPLVTIKGFLGFLEKDALAGHQDKVTADIQHIQNATDKMQQLLNDLLELSRIGRLVNATEKISPHKLIDEASEFLKGAINENSVCIQVENTLPAEIYGDRARLLEVFLNLLENAIKFMGEQLEPQIEIGAFEQHDSTVCYIRDNGQGIPEGQGDKIFEMFRRLTPEIPGTGIGLALVKRIVDLHGGRIWVESDGEGHGATFYFTLPTSPPISPQAAAMHS